MKCINKWCNREAIEDLGGYCGLCEKLMFDAQMEAYEQAKEKEEYGD